MSEWKGSYKFFDEHPEFRCPLCNPDGEFGHICCGCPLIWGYKRYGKRISPYEAWKDELEAGIVPNRSNWGFGELNVKKV